MKKHPVRLSCIPALLTTILLQIIIRCILFFSIEIKITIDLIDTLTLNVRSHKSIPRPTGRINGLKHKKR